MPLELYYLHILDSLNLHYITTPLLPRPLPPNATTLECSDESNVVYSGYF